MNIDDETRKKIERLSEVKRKGSSDDQFSLAQRRLAEIYYKHGLLSEAIRVSKLIEPQDNKEHYEKAQYNIGAAYDEQGKTGKALEIWMGIEEDSSEVYSRAQYNIGNIRNRLGEFEEAKKAWSRVKQKGSPEAYTKAQYNLASHLIEEGKEDDAFRVWDNIEKEYDPGIYARSQFNIGIVLNRKGDIKKAIEVWEKIEEEDSLDAFNRAQYNIGTVLLEDTIYRDFVRAENAFKRIVSSYQYEKRCLIKICRLLKTSSIDIRPLAKVVVRHNVYY